MDFFSHVNLRRAHRERKQSSSGVCPLWDCFSLTLRNDGVSFAPINRDRNKNEDRGA